MYILCCAVIFSLFCTFSVSFFIFMQLSCLSESSLLHSREESDGQGQSLSLYYMLCTLDLIKLNLTMRQAKDILTTKWQAICPQINHKCPWMRIVASHFIGWPKSCIIPKSTNDSSGFLFHTIFSPYFTTLCNNCLYKDRSTLLLLTYNLEVKLVTSQTYWELYKPELWSDPRSQWKLMYQPILYQTEEL